MKFRRTLAPILVVFAGFAAAALLIATGPEVEMAAPEAVAPMVRTVEVHPETLQLTVHTNGTVAPRTESDLVPEVSGSVLEKSEALVSGGFFARGDVLLRIDPLDYAVALEQAKAALARAESELHNARKDLQRQSSLKQHNATSEAQRDDSINRVRIGEASMREARAWLSRTRRDLDRTELKAPYDGRVRSERVDVGQFVNRGSAVATIYAVDTVEIRLPIHDDELAFLDLPMVYGGSQAHAIPVILQARFAGAVHQWHGEVVRTEGELDPRTRMVNVVASVKDPYLPRDGRPPLSVGLFVEAEIQGATFDNVTLLPRSALRADNQVYVIDDANRLHFREVTIMRVDQDQVFITAGLQPGERVCISPIQATADGMLVRTAAPGQIPSTRSRDFQDLGL